MYLVLLPDKNSLYSNSKSYSCVYLLGNFLPLHLADIDAQRDAALSLLPKLKFVRMELSGITANNESQD